MKAQIPNILTSLRMVLCLVMFWGFALISNDDAMGHRSAPFLAYMVLGSFVVAAVTDFFDGWLARKWNVTSMFGAILDPIADKILVCGAILGLLTFNVPDTLFPGAMLIFSGLILFREFAVSAMREVLAPRGIKLPVTFLAKTKTTVQLVSLAALMFAYFWTAWGFETDGAAPYLATQGAMILYGLAAAITLWTGAEYASAAMRALRR